ncbi:hypothetical protein ACLESD_51750, partial [Pyxidicoccus sp. 3LFB2]
MSSWRPRAGAGYALLFAVLFLAFAPSRAAAQQTTVQRLGTPSLSGQPGQSITLAMRFNAVPMPENYEVFV